MVIMGNQTGKASLSFRHGKVNKYDTLQVCLCDLGVGHRIAVMSALPVRGIKRQ